MPESGGAAWETRPALSLKRAQRASRASGPARPHEPQSHSFSQSAKTGCRLPLPPSIRTSAPDNGARPVAAAHTTAAEGGGKGGFYRGRHHTVRADSGQAPRTEAAPTPTHGWRPGPRTLPRKPRALPWPGHAPTTPECPPGPAGPCGPATEAGLETASAAHPTGPALAQDGGLAQPASSGPGAAKTAGDPRRAAPGDGTTASHTPRNERRPPPRPGARRATPKEHVRSRPPFLGKAAPRLPGQVCAPPSSGPPWPRRPAEPAHAAAGGGPSGKGSQSDTPSCKRRASCLAPQQITSDARASSRARSRSCAAVTPCILAPSLANASAAALARRAPSDTTPASSSAGEACALTLRPGSPPGKAAQKGPQRCVLGSRSGSPGPAVKADSVPAQSATTVAGSAPKRAMAVQAMSSPSRED